MLQDGVEAGNIQPTDMLKTSVVAGSPVIVCTVLDKGIAGEYVTRGCPSQRVVAFS